MMPPPWTRHGLRRGPLDPITGWTTTRCAAMTARMTGGTGSGDKARGLQRIEEPKQQHLQQRVERHIGSAGTRSFATVGRDRVTHVERAAVVEEHFAVAEPGENARADLRRQSTRGADISQARAQVVQQQVGIEECAFAIQRRDVTRARRETGDVTGGTAEAGEETLAPNHGVSRRVGRLGSGRERTQEADEIRQPLHRGQIDLGVRRGVAPLRQRSPVESLLGGPQGVRQAHLQAQRGADEIHQRGDVRLATESSHGAVRGASRPPRDAIAILIFGIRPAQDLVFRNDLHQTKTEQKRCGEASARGRGGWDGFAFNAECFEDGRGLPPNVLPAVALEIVTGRRRHEPRGLDHPLLAGPAARRVRVTGAALVLVEQRPQPLIRREDLVKERLAGVELRQLRRPKAREWGARLRGHWDVGWLGAGRANAQEEAHGYPYPWWCVHIPHRRAVCKESSPWARSAWSRSERGSGRAWRPPALR